MTLVFDTETTGKADFNAPVDAPHQPRIVQLGAILFDDKKKIVSELNVVLKPDNWTIPKEAFNIHGFTTEYCEKYGLPERVGLGLFDHLLSKAEILVAHNISFDLILIKGAYKRHGQTFPEVKTFCTMTTMTPICKLPGGRNGEYKWPQLKEAYWHAFSEMFASAHDAMADVRACARIYHWLQDGQPKVSHAPLVIDGTNPITPTPTSIPSESKQEDGQPNHYDPAFTDDDIMPWGKYKGTKLVDVEPDYLLWMWHDGCRNEKLRNYIWNSRHALNEDRCNQPRITKYKP